MARRIFLNREYCYAINRIMGFFLKFKGCLDIFPCRGSQATNMHLGLEFWNFRPIADGTCESRVMSLHIDMPEVAMCIPVLESREVSNFSRFCSQAQISCGCKGGKSD